MADTFALDIAAFARKAKAAQDHVVRKIATDLLTRIVLRTPVGNPSLWKGKPPAGYVGGRARANWNVSLGRPDHMVTAITDKNGQTTIYRAMAPLAAWKADDAIYITNSLPYIRTLEYEGHSKQAPAGMVRISVAEFQTFVDDAVRSIPK
ncbi:hypothetical protein [Lysobacter sp.]|uniref:hypothetical protein n=1 Tax=Lysobacter sp. TaxID=72226 RepID=UPI002D599EA6|nr:hypothetical protein [Lysobacter sp.]HZX76156.1 hypothetical protein [Lysobacter sp.]